MTNPKEFLVDEIRDMNIVTPYDLIDRLKSSQKIVTKLEKVEYHAVPVPDVSVSFFERTGFYIKQVIPYVVSILTFYFPLPPLLREKIMETVNTDTKPFYLSKTFWTNVILAVAGIFGIAEDQISAELVVAIITLINILLRFITKKEITIK